MLDRVDVHCIWVSQAVMDLLPPEKKFPNATIPGGEIPSEGVFCDNAMEVVYNIYPRPGRAEKIKWLNRAMSELNKVGFVGVHDAGVIEEDLMLYTWYVLYLRF